MASTLDAAKKKLKVKQLTLTRPALNGFQFNDPGGFGGVGADPTLTVRYRGIGRPVLIQGVIEVVEIFDNAPDAPVARPPLVCYLHRNRGRTILTPRTDITFRATATAGVFTWHADFDVPAPLSGCWILRVAVPTRQRGRKSIKTEISILD